MSKRRQKQIESQITLGFLCVVFLFFFITGGSLPKTIGLTLISSIFVIGLLIYLAIQRKRNLRRSGISDIDSMTGIQFEYYLKELYQALGYKTRVTQASGDYGADLLLEINKRKIVVQAKRYSKNVGVKAVQEIKTSQLHYKADESWVVTNSYFTKQAIILAASNDVLLINRDVLIKTIMKMNSSQVVA